MCGEKFEVHPNREGQRYCSRGCAGDFLSEKFSGSGHPQWKGGGGYYTALRRAATGTWWKARNKALEKADSACEHCGSRSRVEVHHIIPVVCGGPNEQWNLIPLCASCHRTAEHFSDGAFDTLIEIAE
ncbi:HNH endonuclease [Saliphagus sp. LR7]|uniref:HNH endonuclease n=1 Tax=Saliphagus sp. LR7 TaxID=2282654 RepID=UPI0037442EBB